MILSKIYIKSAFQEGLKKTKNINELKINKKWIKKLKEAVMMVIFCIKKFVLIANLSFGQKKLMVNVAGTLAALLK